MLKTATTLLIFFLCCAAKAQALPDSLSITSNLYAAGFELSEYLYNQSVLTIQNKNGVFYVKGKRINQSAVSQLLQAMNHTVNFEDNFKQSGLDTLKIKNKPDKLLKYSATKFDWNKQQLDYILPKLSDIQNYKLYYKDWIEANCCVRMHSRYRTQYSITVYSGGKVLQEITSRQSVGGVKVPWTDAGQSDLNYNLDIESALYDILDVKKAKLLQGNALLKYLSRKIIDFYKPGLYKLAAYKHYDEIQQLTSDFDIIDFGKVYTYGRYTWDIKPTYQVKLHNKAMLPNVELIFFATEIKDKLYPQDSLKAEYASIVNRVQSLSFITKYLEGNLNRKLTIYYFNNAPINNYIAHNINKNQEEWAKYDHYLDEMKRYDTVVPKPDFASDASKKISEHNHCGCNLRLDKQVIEKAVVFEIINEDKDNSSWVLLPDGTALLYVMQGAKVLQYDYTTWGNKYSGVQYPCKLITAAGTIIK